MSLPQVLSTLPQLLEWRRLQTRRIGFVPTMGALHEGHAKLLEESRKACDITVLSIFVNPAQFGPGEDLAKYPRTLESDLEIAAKEGVQVVFLPSVSELYPGGYSTFVEEFSLSQPLCGEHRPGHFRGVATIVLKLFNLVRPHTAFFGLKDAQQFFVIQKMVKDLNLDLTVHGIPTVREPDGLALSSRNRYLSVEERKTAPALYEVLRNLQEECFASEKCLASRVTAIGANDSDAASVGLGLSAESLGGLLSQSRAQLESAGFIVQYLDCLELPHFQKASGLRPGRTYLIAAAAFLGKTRLIDNVVVNPQVSGNKGSLNALAPLPPALY